jgi:hypothetical protein
VYAKKYGQSPQQLTTEGNVSLQMNRSVNDTNQNAAFQTEIAPPNFNTHVEPFMTRQEQILQNNKTYIISIINKKSIFPSFFIIFKLFIIVFLF